MIRKTHTHQKVQFVEGGGEQGWKILSEGIQILDNDIVEHEYFIATLQLNQH